MPIIRAFAVLQIPLIGKSLLRVIFGTNVFLLVRAVGTSALASIVNPAHEIIVVRFLANPRQIRCKDAAHHLIAFADRMARQASAGLEQFLAMSRIAGLVFG